MSAIHGGKLGLQSTQLPVCVLWAKDECGLLLLPEACACLGLDQATGKQPFFLV